VNTRSCIGAVLFFIGLAINIITFYPVQAFPESAGHRQALLYCEPYNDKKITCYPSNAGVVCSIINGSLRKIYCLQFRCRFLKRQEHYWISHARIIGRVLIINKATLIPRMVLLNNFAMLIRRLARTILSLLSTLVDSSCYVLFLFFNL
jgi:hypothetical protein